MYTIPTMTTRAVLGATASIGLVMILAPMVAGCSSEPTRGPAHIVHYAPTFDDSITVTVDTCNGDPVVTDLVEGPDEVTVAITSTKTDPGDACLDDLVIALAASIGGRTVIDASNGREVIEFAP